LERFYLARRKGIVSGQQQQRQEESAKVVPSSIEY